MKSNETIVDRVVLRLKSQPLGDLITEEDLHDIVKEAIPKTFFEKRKELDRSGYNTREVEKEPAIFEIMRELLKESASKAVKEWVLANSDRLMENWKIVIDVGLLNYVKNAQDEQATRHLSAALNNLINELNNERIKAGLPYMSTKVF